jgi:hypothetical protein
MDEATPFAELQGLIADVHLLLRDVRLERQMLFSIALQSGGRRDDGTRSRLPRNAGRCARRTAALNRRQIGDESSGPQAASGVGRLLIESTPALLVAVLGMGVQDVQGTQLRCYRRPAVILSGRPPAQRFE